MHHDPTPADDAPTRAELETTTAEKAPKRVRVDGVPNLYQRPKDKRFEAGLTIDGRWTMRTLPAKTKTDAKRELNALKAKLDRGEAVAPSKRTFADVADEWLTGFRAKVAAGEKAPRTMDAYDYQLRARLLPALGSTAVQKITAERLARMIASWRDAGLSTWTQKGALVPLGLILDMAARRGYIAENPAKRLSRDERPGQARRGEQRILSRDEIGRLLDAAPDSYRLLISTAIFSGLRQGELLGLQWRDIDFDAGIIRVRHQLSRPATDRPAGLVSLKSEAARRDVVLLPQLGNLLRVHKVASRFSAEGAFVFANAEGAPRNYRNVSRRGLDKATESAGLRPMKWHGLRHTFASHLILDLGLDVAQVSRQLGHASPSITLDVYVHLFDQSRHADDIRSRMEESAFGRVLDTRS